LHEFVLVAEHERTIRMHGLITGHDDLLADITGWPPEQLEPAVREAISRQILTVDERSATYRFRHTLLAEVVAAELLPGEQRRLHEDIATWGSAPGSGRPGRATSAELAHHWYAAHRPVEALTESIAASRFATSVYAHVDALRQAERAVDLWEEAPDPEEATGLERVDVLRLAAEAANNSGKSSRAVELWRMALAEVDEDADPLAAALLHSKLAYNLWTAGDSQASLVEHRRAVGLVPPEPPTVERARVVGGLASALMPAGHYRESRELCEEAIATLRAAGSHDGEARLLNVLGVDLVGLGDVDAGLDHLRVAVRLARETGAVDSQLVSQHNLCFFLGQTDRFEEGLKVAFDGLETARRVGSVSSSGSSAQRPTIVGGPVRDGRSGRRGRVEVRARGGGRRDRWAVRPPEVRARTGASAGSLPFHVNSRLFPLTTSRRSDACTRGYARASQATNASCSPDGADEMTKAPDRDPGLSAGGGGGI